MRLCARYYTCVICSSAPMLLLYNERARGFAESFCPFSYCARAEVNDEMITIHANDTQNFCNCARTLEMRTLNGGARACFIAVIIGVIRLSLFAIS
jgi:hypothetical protein